MVAVVKVVCRHRVRVKYLSKQVPPAKGSRLIYLTPLVSFVPSPQGRTSPLTLHGLPYPTCNHVSHTTDLREKSGDSSSTNGTDEFARQTHWQTHRVRTIRGCSRPGDSWEGAYRLKLRQYAADFPMLLVFVYLTGNLQVSRPVSNKVLQLQNFCRGNPGVEHLLHA